MKDYISYILFTSLKEMLMIKESTCCRIYNNSTKEWNWAVTGCLPLTSGGTVFTHSRLCSSNDRGFNY